MLEAYRCLFVVQFIYSSSRGTSQVVLHQSLLVGPHHNLVSWLWWGSFSRRPVTDGSILFCDLSPRFTLFVRLPLYPAPSSTVHYEECWLLSNLKGVLVLCKYYWNESPGVAKITLAVVYSLFYSSQWLTVECSRTPAARNLIEKNAVLGFIVSCLLRFNKSPIFRSAAYAYRKPLLNKHLVTPSVLSYVVPWSNQIPFSHSHFEISFSLFFFNSWNKLRRLRTHMPSHLLEICYYIVWWQVKRILWPHWT